MYVFILQRLKRRLAGVFLPALLFYSFTDVEIGAVFYRYVTGAVSGELLKRTWKEAGPVVQEGMAGHPASNGEDVTLQQLLGR